MSSNNSENYETYRAELFKRFFDTDSYFFLCLSTSLQHISSKRDDFKEDDYFVIGKVIQVLVDSENPAQTLMQFHELPSFREYVNQLDDGIVRLQLPDLEQDAIHEIVEKIAEQFVQTFAEILSDRPSYKQLLRILGVPPRKKIISGVSDSDLLKKSTQDLIAEPDNHEQTKFIAPEKNGRAKPESSQHEKVKNGSDEKRNEEKFASAMDVADKNKHARIQPEMSKKATSAHDLEHGKDIGEFEPTYSQADDSAFEEDADTREMAENHPIPSRERHAEHAAEQTSINGNLDSPFDGASWQNLLNEVAAPQDADIPASEKPKDSVETFAQHRSVVQTADEQTAVLSKRSANAAKKDERYAEFRHEADLYFRVIDEALEQLMLNRKSRIAFENLELAAYSLKSVARKLGLEHLAKLPEQVEELIGKIVLLRVSPGNAAYVTIKRSFALIKNIRSQRDIETAEYRELSNSLLRLTRSMDELQKSKNESGANRSNQWRSQIQQNIDTFRMAEMSA